MGSFVKLVLGVNELYYSDDPKGITTGDVATILEAHYGVMQGYVDLHIADIAGALENSFAGAIENLMMGAPPDLNVLGSATSKIDQGFREYLEKEEITKIGNAAGIGIAGVPTKAALMGVNHRLKLHHGPRRPSFIDTGIYFSSFHSWIEL